MDDFELRVTTMLRDRVAPMEPHLDGPTIRALAGRRQRLYLPLAAAAAVLVVVLTSLVVSVAVAHHPSHHIQPGGPVTVHSGPSTPVPTARPTPTRSTAAPTPTGPGLPIPTITRPLSSAQTLPTTPPGAPVTAPSIGAGALAPRTATQPARVPSTAATVR
jgi:hypothetical protein